MTTLKHKLTQSGDGDIDADAKLALAMLAEDQRAISYRPGFARLTGSVTAAILLQQIFYRFTRTGKSFFKFRSPNSHKDYRQGDSWQEELEFSGCEFDAALAKIGTKIVKGMSKSEPMAEKEPEFDEKGRMLNLDKLVIYWTDSNRCTWYWLNLGLLGNAIKSIYLGNSGKSNYLVIQESTITSNSEKRSKNTKSTHTHGAPALLSPSPISASVCVAKSKFSFEERARHAERNGLGSGWLNLSASGRYDEVIEYELSRQSPVGIQQSRNSRADERMFYSEAVQIVSSLTAAGRSAEDAINDLPVDEEVRDLLLDKFVRNKELAATA